MTFNLQPSFIENSIKYFFREQNLPLYPLSSEFDSGKPGTGVKLVVGKIVLIYDVRGIPRNVLVSSLVIRVMSN